MKRLILIVAIILVSVVCFQLGCDDDDNPITSSEPQFPYDQNIVSIERTDWQLSSIPYQLDESRLRGRLLWHRPRETPTFAEVFGNDGSVGEEPLHTLRLVFRPTYQETTSMFWDQDPQNQADSMPVPDVRAYNNLSWAGITSFWADPIEDSTEYFEVRARANSGVMHIEFGHVSEDIDGNGIPFNEDRQPVGWFPESEDVGWDSLPDEQEPFYHPLHNPDPSHDNWYVEGAGRCPWPATVCNNHTVQDTIWDNDSIYFEYLNGTEGNRYDYENLAEPDKEVMSWRFYETNAYYSYEIDFGDPGNPFRLDYTMTESSDPMKPWYTYRLPIRDTTASSSISDGYEPVPEWDESGITHIRIWFEGEPGQTTPDTVEVAAMYFRNPL